MSGWDSERFFCRWRKADCRSGNQTSPSRARRQATRRLRHAQQRVLRTPPSSFRARISLGPRAQHPIRPTPTSTRRRGEPSRTPFTTGTGRSSATSISRIMALALPLDMGTNSHSPEIRHRGMVQASPISRTTNCHLGGTHFRLVCRRKNPLDNEHA